MNLDQPKVDLKVKPVISKRKRKKAIPKTLRASVWNRYIGEEIGCTLCLVCKNNKISQMTFVCGHVIPESKGGKTNVDNLRPICNQCNLSMGTENLDEFCKQYFSEETKAPL